MSIETGDAVVARSERILVRVLSFLMAGAVLFVALHPFAPYHSQDRFYLSFFMDDFYYYLGIARNVLDGKGFTWDGDTFTNGFQPLWQGVVIVLLWIWGDSLPFFLSVALLSGGLILAGGYCFWRLARLLSFTSPALHALVYVAVAQASTTMWGMESVMLFVLLPLLLMAAVRVMQDCTPVHVFRYALVASFCVLARLDAGLLVFLLLLFHWRVTLQFFQHYRLFIAGFCGSLPLIAYLLLNLSVFDTLLPISGVAKNLTLAITTHTEVKLRIICAVLFLVILLPSLFSGRMPFSAEKRVIFRAVACFCLLFYVFQSLGGWLIWFWYNYSLVLAFPFVLFILLYRIPAHARVVFLLVVVFILASFFVYRAWRQQDYSGCCFMYDVPLGAKDFIRQHEGRYAMGDLAGFTSYIGGKPVLQLEGLVGDKKILQSIRQEKSLKEFLDMYNIDYYITFHPAHFKFRDKDGCYSFEEPKRFQAGERSPKMRGRTCAAPVFQKIYSLSNFQLSLSIFDVKTIESVR